MQSGPWLATLAALAVLVVTLRLTHLAWQRTTRAEEEEVRADFDFRVRDAAARVEARMEAYEQVLRGAAALFGAAEVVDREAFRGYVAALRLEDHHPGIQGVGFSVLVPARALEAHLAQVRGEGFPEYSIRPPGPRDPYSSIIYLEPFRDRNLRAFGYDMFSEPVRRAAMEKARDEGLEALSARVTLVQETDREVQFGVLLYLPVYRGGRTPGSEAERRSQLVGWAYMPFRMGDLMKGILGERARELRTRVHDGAEATAESLLFDSEPALDGAPRARFTGRQAMQVVDRTWSLEVHSTPAFEARSSSGTPRWVAGGGVAISLLLAVLVWVLATGRARALQLAAVINRRLLATNAALAESEARFRTMADGAPALIWVAALDSRFNWVNVPWLEFTGGTLDGEQGLGWTAGVHPDDLSGLLEAFVSHFAQRAPFGLQFRLRRRDGAFRWMECAARPRTDDHGELLGFVGACVDISERREAEEAAARAHHLAQATLDAMPEHLCVLDEAGTIIAVNSAWSAFAEANGAPGAAGFLGASYLAACAQPAGPGAAQAAGFGDGLRKVLSGEAERFALDYPCHGAGQERWFVGVATRFEVAGQVRVVVAHTDVSARVEADAAIRESEARFRALFENGPDATLLTRPDGTIQAANPAACRLLGWAAWELARMRRSEITAPGQPATPQGRRGGAPIDVTYRRADGTFFIGATTSASFGDGPSEGRSLLVIRDVSEWRRLELALKESEDRFRRLVDNLAAGVVVREPDTSITFANARAAELLGLSFDQLRGKLAVDPVWRFLRADGTAMPRKELPASRVVVTGVPVVDQVLGIDRRAPLGRVWVLVNAYPTMSANGHLQQVVETFVDITDRKRTELALQEREARLRAYFESPAIGVVVTSKDGTLLEANASFCRLLGASPSELLGTRVQDLTHPDDLGREGENAGRLVAGELRKYELEKRYLHRDGSPVWSYVTMALIRPDGGGAEQVIGMVTDIRPRKAAEEALVASERRLKAALEEQALVLENATVGITLVRQRRQIWASVQMERMFGYSSAEMDGVETRVFFPSDAAWEALVARCDPELRAGRTYVGEHQLRRKDGSLLWARLQGRQVERDDPAAGAIWCIEDVSDLKRLGAQASQAERLAATATLARGMAHEVNSPLASVIGNLGFVEEQLAPAAHAAPGPAALAGVLPEVLLAVRDAVDGAARIKAIVADLRSFALGDLPVGPSSGAVAEAARDARRVAAQDLAACREVAIEVPEGCPLPIPHPDLVQLLAHLLINAGQATGAGPNDVRLEAAVSGGAHLLLRVRDTGVGMTEAVRARAFDPFFTTKDVGKGRGLGLSVCLGIVQAAGGEIALESRPGEGTTVTVRLPVGRPAAPTEAA